MSSHTQPFAGPVVKHSSLLLGDNIGDGGQGSVFALRDSATTVYKQFTASVDGAALDKLMSAPEQMSFDHRSAIRERTAWPHTAVLDEAGRVCGALMPRIPSKFGVELTAGGASSSEWCELQYLCFPDKATNLGVQRPSDSELLRLLAGWAELVALLHAHGVIAGDISMRNWLWCLRPNPDVFVIDCDSFHLSNGDGPHPYRQTPEWNDSELTSPQYESDSYKFGLVVLRTVLGDYHATIRDVRRVSELRRMLTPVLIELLERCAGGVSERPSLQEWAAGFGVDTPPAAGDGSPAEYRLAIRAADWDRAASLLSSREVTAHRSQADLVRRFAGAERAAAKASFSSLTALLETSTTTDRGR